MSFNVRGSSRAPEQGFGVLSLVDCELWMHIDIISSVIDQVKTYSAILYMYIVGSY